MSDLMQSAAEWLGGMFQQHVSRAMVYCRGQERINFLGTLDKPAEIRDETAAGGTMTTDHSDRDIVFPAAAIAALTPAEPQDGDKIEIALVGTHVEVYEVLPPPGSKSWRRCDALGKYLRVHTKKCEDLPLGHIVVP